MAWVWTKSSASGMQDIACAARKFNSNALAGLNGTIWRMPSWDSFTQEKASGFRRVAMSPDGDRLYGVGENGTVWYSTSPNIWKRLEATDQLGPVEDAVVNLDDSLWLTLKNGQMWSIRDGKQPEWRTTLTPFKRLAVGQNNNWWGIDKQGYLLCRNGNLDEAYSYWRDTNGSGMEDVSVSADGTVWLVGGNGTVWHTRDGQSFTQIVEASDFHSVSVQGSDFIYLVGNNGTLWVYQTVPDAPPQPKAPPKKDDTEINNPLLPVLGSYDVKTFTLKGENFLPSHPVYVRLSMIGNTIANAYGNGIPDTRDTSMQFTSDSVGKLTANIDPRNVLPHLNIDDQGTYVYGCFPGEKLHFSAHDGRQNFNDTTNILWSNTLTITC